LKSSTTYCINGAERAKSLRLLSLPSMYREEPFCIARPNNTSTVSAFDSNRVLKNAYGKKDLMRTQPFFEY
jgi:hypothetical protein